MYRIISNGKVVAICDRFRWVRMMDGVLVGTIRATAQGFEARVPVAEGESYTFEKQVYALSEGGLTGTDPVGQIVEFHGAVDLQDRDAVVSILAGEQVSKTEAHNLRGFIETAVQSLSDEDALNAATLHQTWCSGVAYVTGNRVLHNSVLYKVLQDHTSQEVWTPDVSPSLFAEVLIPDDSVIPAWVQPDSMNTYTKGDKVIHDGITWASDYDNNSWEPGVFGWTEVN